jgi:DprA/Smf-like nucleotide binding protein involved in DNA uptake
MQHLSSAFDASEGSRHEVEYDPTLSGPELLATVRALLATRRRAEQLICRYLADLADRVQEQRDEWLGARVQSVGEAAIREPVEDIARRHLGLRRRNTLERIRVGRALRALPQVERAFIEGELSYSRVREVTRIATATTEVVWLELARTLDMRTLERRVAQANGAMGGGGDPWLRGHAENDGDPRERRSGLGGVVRDATSAVPAGHAPHGEVFGADAANDCGDCGDCGDRGEADAAYARREDPPSEGRARAHASVEWTSPTTVRVSLELTRAAWILLQPAVDAALRESAARSYAGEGLAVVAPLAPDAKPRQADAREPSNGAEPPLASESAPLGVESAPLASEAAPLSVEPPWVSESACAEPSRAVQRLHGPDRVSEVHAPGMSPQAKAGATHLGILGAMATDGVEGERVARGVSQAAAAGATHLGILGAMATDGVDGAGVPRGVADAIGATQPGILNPLLMDGGGEIGAPGMLGDVVVGGSHVGRALPIAPDWAGHARVAVELVAVGGRGPLAAGVDGDGGELPIRSTLPGIGYAPAARVLEVMGGRGGWSLDSLVEASGLLVQQVSAALTFLTLDGYVRQRAGSFVRC